VVNFVPQPLARRRKQRAASCFVSPTNLSADAALTSEPRRRKLPARNPGEKRTMVQDSLSPQAIAAAAESAGLTLTDDQLADLVTACRAFAPVLARLPRDLPFSAEPAHVFDPRSFMSDAGKRR
jgi:hypothetical protein